MTAHNATPDVDEQRRARRINIRTRRLVDGIFAGHYHSVFRGTGIEFAEVREYVPGDDVRTIDWNVTARFGTPFIKRHVEERELTVMLLVDVSASGRFGSARQLKTEAAVNVCALLAASAARNNDMVGLILFSDRIEKFIAPRKDRHGTLRLIREMLGFRPEGSGTDLNAGLEYLYKVVRRRSVTFLISDFLASGYETAMRMVHRRHDVVPICLSDRRERALPPVGLIAMRDLETGRQIMIDTKDPRVRREYSERWQAAAAARRALFHSLGVDVIELDTEQDHIEPLLRFFRRREKRLREGR